MVKQSRRQVGLKKRSMRRRTAKKRVMKRRTMKGGYKNGELGTFNRQKFPGLVLYTVKIEKDETGENMRYIMDFSTVGRIVAGIMDRKNIENITKEYAQTLIDAFGVSNESSIQIIMDTMMNVFEGGVNGAKTRKLIITDMVTNNFVKMQLVENGDNKGDVITFEKGPGASLGGYYEKLTTGYVNGYKLKKVSD